MRVSAEAQALQAQLAALRRAAGPDEKARAFEALLKGQQTAAATPDGATTEQKAAAMASVVRREAPLAPATAAAQPLPRPGSFIDIRV
jgi:hypothetical protein